MAGKRFKYFLIAQNFFVDFDFTDVAIAVQIIAGDGVIRNVDLVHFPEVD